MILAMVLNTALAGDVFIQGNLDAFFYCDNQQIPMVAGQPVVTSALSPGNHYIEARNQHGQPIASLMVAVPYDGRAVIDYRHQTLSHVDTLALTNTATMNTQVQMGMSVSDNGFGVNMNIADGGMNTNTVDAGFGMNVNVQVKDDAMVAGSYVEPVAVQPVLVQPVVTETVYVETVVEPEIVTMPRGQFQGLLRQIEEASFSDDKLGIIRSVATYHYFDCHQVSQIIALLSFSDDKVNAVRILRDVIVDPQNAYTLESGFTFSDDKNKVRALFNNGW